MRKTASNISFVSIWKYPCHLKWREIQNLTFFLLLFFSIGSKPLLSETTQIIDQKQTLPDSQNTRNFQTALTESVRYFERMPPNTKIRLGEITYSKSEMVESLLELKKIMNPSSLVVDQSLLKKRFELKNLSPSVGPPTITGYYEVRIYGKTKPEGEYQYPALSPPISKPDNRTLENPYLFSREKWKEKSVWEKYSKPIVFLRLTDLHLAQLEGSALVQTETNELFRINYAADNGQNYISPSVYLKGICPSLKPYQLTNCIQSKPKEVTEAIFKNPRYIFFEKETQTNPKTKEEELGPLGSGGIRLVAFRSVAMDKKIPLGFPVLLSFQSSDEQANDRLVFVHDRGNAITGEGRLDYYLGSGKGVEEVANNLLTKGKVTLLLPKKKNR
ncbi:MltA domain-containing protein [Leptospira vanthielii]|uniref:peptidoglycan lytic exotransglycosylase n=1 Tax=Leptospira vanthielii TaxID=293085 RepID=A0ABY2NMW7_9LEPT|nr:MltA domain-containing protein [Leptospira vanthielii]TGM52335.1 murein transglycosylase [Leptospira vanthielii]